MVEEEEGPPPPIDYIKMSGGLFFDMTIHDFDLARFLFGDVDELYASGRVLVDPAIGSAHSSVRRRCSGCERCWTTALMYVIEKSLPPPQSVS